jgi:hypothetical protein
LRQKFNKLRKKNLIFRNFNYANRDFQFIKCIIKLVSRCELFEHPREFLALIVKPTIDNYHALHIRINLQDRDHIFVAGGILHHAMQINTDVCTYHSSTLFSMCTLRTMWVTYLSTYLPGVISIYGRSSCYKIADWVTRG